MSVDQPPDAGGDAADFPERAAVAQRVPPPTPIYISPRTRNILIFAVVVALVLFIREASSVLTIGLGGALLALILSFPVRLLSMIMPRSIAILITLIVLIGSIVLGILILIPLLIEQLGGLVDSLPELSAEGELLLRDMLRPLQEQGWISDNTEAIIEDLRAGAVERLSQITEGLLDDLLGAVSSIADLAVKAFGIVFVAIYLLLDTRRIKAAFLSAAPYHYRRDAQVLWEDFGTSLSRYLGGLAVSLVVQGVLTGVTLWLLGIPYPLLLGLWVSLTAIIPYLGAFLGAIPAVILAFYQSPTIGVAVIGLYILIQQLESNVLTPRIQGQAVRVHPIIILLTVIGMSEIDGLRGAVFAVPTLAVLRVLLDFFMARLRVRQPGVVIVEE